MRYSFRVALASLTAVTLVPIGVLIFSLLNDGVGLASNKQAQIDFQWKTVAGEDRTLKQVDADATYLFFGFFSCSEICPIRIHQVRTLSQTLDGMMPAPSVQMLFITIDPNNDSASLRQTMIDQVSDRMWSAELSAADLNRVQAQLNERVKMLGGEPSHNGSLYLLDRQKKLMKVYTRLHLPIEALISDLTQLN